MASWRQWLVAACWLFACASAQAAVRLQADTLELPGVALAKVSMHAALAADGRPQLALDAGQVSVPALGWHDVGLSLTGQPQQAAGNAWKFTGHVATRRAPGGALSDATVVVLFDPDAGTLEVDVRQGKGELHALMPLDQASHLQMQLSALPLAWLRGVLAAAWPEGRLKGGSVTGAVALDFAEGGTRVSGRVRLSGADLDSKGGNIATQGLAADGSFRIERGLAATSIMFDGTLGGGELLLGPLYAQLPGHSAALHVAATLAPAGIAIDSLDYDDRDALRVSGKLGFDRAGNLQRLDLTRFAATFPAAYTRYGTTLVQGMTGLSKLVTAGSLVGSLRTNGGDLQALELTAENFALESPGGGLAVAGLDGRIDWQAGASRPATTLGWNALALERITFGQAKLALQDRAGALTLAAPASVPVLGGNFQLDRFAWRPGAGSAQGLSLGFALTAVDVRQLCAALGWPAFGGKLGGAVPEVSWRGDQLVFAGGLSVNVFGGSVSVTDLALRHLFGSAPQVVGNIDLQQLDLAQLTGVFDFGQITGRLDGSIHGLRLVDWKPTAFAAKLAANDGGKISQHAIKSLTEVGGGGIASGLQGMALRLFKTFSYARIGLSCTLAEGVCTMAGMTPDPDAGQEGYTIVQGSGLPRITVIGHQRAVDWATLVSRLKAATEGDGPVVK